MIVCHQCTKRRPKTIFASDRGRGAADPHLSAVSMGQLPDPKVACALLRFSLSEAHLELPRAKTPQPPPDIFD